MLHIFDYQPTGYIRIKTGNYEARYKLTADWVHNHLFDLDLNGTLAAEICADFENNESNYSIRVRSPMNKCNRKSICDQFAQ